MIYDHEYLEDSVSAGRSVPRHLFSLDGIRFCYYEENNTPIYFYLIGTGHPWDGKSTNSFWKACIKQILEQEGYLN